MWQKRDTIPIGKRVELAVNRSTTSYNHGPLSLLWSLSRAVLDHWPGLKVFNAPSVLRGPHGLTLGTTR